MARKTKPPQPNKAQAQSSQDGVIYQRLKARHRAEREHYGEEWGPRFGLRIHRALSWLNKAEQSSGDTDTCFLALWIGFNAAYAGDIGGQMDGRSTLREVESFHGFLGKVCRLDEAGRITAVIRAYGTGALRNLLDSHYIFQPFWDCQNGVPGAADWEARFQRERKKAHTAWLGTSDSADTLKTLFERLYTLRNQLVHGGATWGSQHNRPQLQDACRILLPLLEAMLETMLDQAAHFDSPAFYPPQ